MAPWSRTRSACAAAALMLLGAVVLASSAAAETRTGRSSAPVVINHVGAASPYPGVIDLDAPGEVVTSLTATVTLRHRIMAEVHVLLQAPDGTAVMLMKRVGCTVNLSSDPVTLTFSPDATGRLPQQAPR